jgi:hypothetical protein
VSSRWKSGLGKGVAPRQVASVASSEGDLSVEAYTAIAWGVY